MIKIYHATEFANNEKPYKHVATIDTESFNMHIERHKT